MNDFKSSIINNNFFFYKKKFSLPDTQSISFVKGEEGTKALIIDGYGYEFCSRSKASVDWKCSYSTLGCLAHAKTDLSYSNVIFCNNEHCHPIDDK